jgi:hypothetical protein
MPKDSEVFPEGTIVRFKNDSRTAIIRQVSFLKDGKGFLNYTGVIEGKKPGQYAIYHDDVEHNNEFTEAFISKVWDELHLRFGFDLKHWKIEFKKYLDTQSRQQPIEGVFYRFGQARINPLLNQILGRGQSHPTFYNLIDYVVSGKPHKKSS